MNGAANQVVRRAQPWLGTIVEISIVVPEADAAASAKSIDAAFVAIALVHRLMSFHETGSDVNAINRLHPGQSIAVDAHTINVLRCALLLEDASAGIFNMACGAQLVAWGQLPAPAGSMAATGVTPSAVARPLIRNAIAIDAQQRVTRTAPAWIDLGGIAKGYAVDLAVDALQAADVGADGAGDADSAGDAIGGAYGGCVNAGGDLRVFGDVDFPVLIRDPKVPTRPGRRLRLRQQALATSAGYFSSRLHEGRQTGALLDARNGQPVSGQRSATVLAPTCMLADALTKVVIATADAAHPVLARFGATAFLI